MHTVDRLIIRQVLKPAIVGLLLLLMLFTGFTGVRLLRSVAMGNLPIDDVIALVAAHDLSALEVLLPTAFFASFVMVMCTWHQQGEPYAFYASGIHPNRISLPLWILAGIVAVVVGVLSLYGRPYAYQLRYDIDARAEHLTSENMEGRQFYKWDGDFVIQAREVRRTQPNLQTVFAQTHRGDQLVILRSAAGQIGPVSAEGLQRIEFLQGFSYAVGDEGRPDNITAFERLVYFVQRPSRLAVSKRRARSIGQLHESGDRKEQAELQWRISLPFIALFMSLMAIELGRLRPKQSPYARYAIAIVLYVVIFNLANLASYAVENGGIPLFPGVYSVLVVLLVAYLAMRRMSRLTLNAPG